jgi:dTMP kinase
VTAEQPIPFLPSRPGEPAVPPAPWEVLRSPTYFRLWLAQVVSSTGDWIGLIAILAVAARIWHNSGAAVSLVLAVRVIPGFFLGTVGGVLIDRLDRRKVMVACDLGRASLLLLLPFVESIFGLVLVSFGLELLTLLWGPAKDASVPSFVDPDQLTSANTFSLVASYATFPLASIVFAFLTALAGWLGAFHDLGAFKLDQEALALLVDACTFLVSAAIVWRLAIPRIGRSTEGRDIDVTQTLRDIKRDIKEGLGFIGREPRVRGIIIGLGLGIIGGGAMIPLGPVFAKEALHGDSAAFGVLMTALGVGAAIGVVALLMLQQRLPREVVFESSLMACGVLMAVAASVTSLFPAALLIGFVGASAGTAYVTGFTALQENVHDEIRGRTFATLYTVIRLCLLLALVVSPLWADFWDWVVGRFTATHAATLAGVTYGFPGSRLALWGGALITFGGGWWARHSMMVARRRAVGVASDVTGSP